MILQTLLRKGLLVGIRQANSIVPCIITRYDEVNNKFALVTADFQDIEHTINPLFKLRKNLLHDMDVISEHEIENYFDSLKKKIESITTSNKKKLQDLDSLEHQRKTFIMIYEEANEAVLA